MNNLRRIQAVYIIAHIGAAYSLSYTLQPRYFLISLAVYAFMQIVCMGISTHRYIAHRGFKTNRILELFLYYVSPFAMVGSPIVWAAVHRYHHAHSDTTHDPHSPLLIPWYKIWAGTYWGDIHVPLSYSRDLITNPHLTRIHRHYFLIIGLVSGVLLFIDPLVFFYGFCWPTVGMYHVVSLGIVLNHKFGFQTFNTQDSSKNNVLLSILTFGDGWHNNHHHDPQNYFHGNYWWEIDLPGLMIRYLFLRDNDKKTKVPGSL